MDLPQVGVKQVDEFLPPNKICDPGDAIMQLIIDVLHVIKVVGGRSTSIQRSWTTMPKTDFKSHL